LPPWAAKKVEKIFRRGMYLAENTSQATSVGFVRLWAHKACAQETAKNCQKAPTGDF